MVEITVTVTKFSHNRFGESLRSMEHFKEVYCTHSMASTMVSKIMDVKKFQGENLENLAFTIQVKELV